MELKNKPLYALRDLASRLGVKAPTACTKTELIAKIEKQKTDIEEHKVKPLLFARGRPRLSNRYIEIKEDEDESDEAIDDFDDDADLYYDDVFKEEEDVDEPYDDVEEEDGYGQYRSRFANDDE